MPDLKLSERECEAAIEVINAFATNWMMQGHTARPGHEARACLDQMVYRINRARRDEVVGDEVHEPRKVRWGQ